MTHVGPLTMGAHAVPRYPFLEWLLDDADLDGWERAELPYEDEPARLTGSTCGAVDYDFDYERTQRLLANVARGARAEDRRQRQAHNSAARQEARKARRQAEAQDRELQWATWRGWVTR